MARPRPRHEEWSRFLLGISRALQLSQLYEPTHGLLADPVSTLTEALRALHEASGAASFHSADAATYVNGARLRTDGQTAVRIAAFFEALSLRRLAGIAFHTPLDEAEWRVLLRAIVSVDRRSPTPFEDLRRALDERGLQGVELIPIQPARMAARYAEVDVEGRVYAVRAVAKTAAVLRLYLENAEDPRRQPFFLQRLQRALQDLVAVCLDDGWKYVGFVHTRAGQGPVCDHGVNVALLSVAVGTRLGFRRARLAELGMAALLHDLGKILHPARLLERTDKFTMEERELLRQSPGIGVRALLREGAWSEGLLKRILVLCEHGSPSDGRAHPFSSLIQVAERFDALTNPRPYRKAILPSAAVRRLVSLRELDRDAVRAFVRTVGPYPTGTVVQLASRRTAVSFHPHPEPEKARAPIVRVALGRDGTIDPRFPVVDLASEGDEVVRAIDPARLGVEVARVLAEATGHDPS